MAAAYYNEVDTFAAAWLRKLIKAGAIAPGEVDERDIREVQPEDLKGFTQCHFFAGIGVWSYAIRAAGWPDNTPVWTGSCPCQSFSSSGKRGGFSDQRHLWPAWFRLIRECAPHTVFGEQVASKDGLAWFDLVSADMEGAGYAIGAADTCAAGFGAPHIRSRLYFVADAPIARRTEAREHDGRSSLLPARSEQCGGIGQLADAQHAGLHRPPGLAPITHSDQPGERIPERDSAAGSVADPQRDGRRPDLTGRQAQGRTADGRDSEAGELADPSNARCEGDGLPPIHRSGDTGRPDMRITGSGATGKLGDTGAPGLPHSQPEELPGARRGEEGRAVTEPGQTLNGFWSNAEWLWCRDGKYRPIEHSTDTVDVPVDEDLVRAWLARNLRGVVPGRNRRFRRINARRLAEVALLPEVYATQSRSFPLAHGAPARVGRLRGYGNALCAEQAKEFIAAYRAIRGWK